MRNLVHLDPDSSILLYNGGTDRTLLRRSGPLEDPRVHIHPTPSRMRWGVLHAFALDCMRYALDACRFDTMTIVDSDQLALRPGYARFLDRHLARVDHVGMLCGNPEAQPADTNVGPVKVARREAALWRPLLQRLRPDTPFPLWSFWPSTVFTRAAAEGLLGLFDTHEVSAIVARSRIWATEEVYFPTLVASLGLRLVKNPCSDDYVKYRATYSPADVQRALERPDVYWMHPVARTGSDPVRGAVRAFHDGYRDAPAPSPIRSRSIVRAVAPIEGWLSPPEAALLVETAADAIRQFEPPHAFVEVGSFCGKGTVALASVLRSQASCGTVHAVDAFDGVVGCRERGLSCHGPTLARLRANVAHAGVGSYVRPVRAPATWHEPMHLLLIDGLHDYASARADFETFAPYLVTGGHLLFHDYADYFPGVVRLVDEVCTGGSYRLERRSESMVVLRKLGAPATVRPQRARSPERAGAPLVSCIMPTSGRVRFLERSIIYFRRQDYPNLELIVVTDDVEVARSLVPDDETRIRIIRAPSDASIGRKRNMACEAANADFIAHWDDDDWMPAHRISCQMGALEKSGADMCGLDRLTFLDVVGRSAWRYVYPPDQRPWLAGATLCYRRSVWKAEPFLDISNGEDTRFVWRRRACKMLAIPHEGLYVAILHGGNTSSRRTHSRRWQSHDVRTVQRVMGEDWAFYESLSCVRA